MNTESAQTLIAHEARLTHIESLLSKLDIDALLAKIGYLETSNISAGAPEVKKTAAKKETTGGKKKVSTYIFFHQQACRCPDFPEILKTLTGYEIPEEHLFDNMKATLQAEFDADVAINPKDAKGKDKKFAFSKTKWGQQLWGKIDNPVKGQKNIVEKLEKIIDILQVEQTDKLDISEYGTERVLLKLGSSDDAEEDSDKSQDDTMF